MTTIRLAIAVFVVAGLASAPFAAEAKKHKHIRHYVSDVQTGGYANGAVSTAGVSMPVNSPHGSSGVSIGTVTAPSVGTYSWPSVGVTNAVPTWSNTMPR
jgi:hypothetical protein